MTILVSFISGVIVGAFFGVLFGRKNKSFANDVAKTAKDTADKIKGMGK